MFKKCYYTCETCNISGNNMTHNCIKCNENYYTIENNELNEGEYINCYNNNLDGYYFDNIDLLYKKCYYTCETCNISGNNMTHNCIKCNENFPYENYISNSKNCYKDKISTIILSSESNIYHYANTLDYLNYSTDDYSELYITTNKLNNTETFTQIIISKSSLSHSYKECSINEILNNNCHYLYNSSNSEILNIIRDNLFAIYSQENKTNKIINGKENTIFQITNSKNELDILQGELMNNYNISILDLGQCEINLKEKYLIKEEDSLIYLNRNL